MCDKTKYFFDEGKEREAAAILHLKLLEGLDDDGAKAVSAFFIKSHVPPAEMPEGRFIFRLEGETRYAHESKAVRSAWKQYLMDKSESKRGQCLITGEIAPIARLHGPIPGFGEKSPILACFTTGSFVSFQKKQGDNAPVSELAEFKYTSALASLIRDPNRKFNFNGDKVVFWAETYAPEEEEVMRRLLTGEIEDKKEISNTKLIRDEGVSNRIQHLLNTIYSGKIPNGLNEGVNFYILSMTNNETRLVIRFFYNQTFGGILNNYIQHLKDIEIVGDFDGKTITPYKILIETAVKGKRENIHPLLESALLRSIFWNNKYPYSLYALLMNRIRATGVNRVRAAMIKGFLNRQLRQNKNINKEEILTMALNSQETDQGYLLGRMFAVLEKAQKDALGNLNATIVDKYLNSALSSPQTVFSLLLKLFEKHVAKSENYYTKKLIEEIMSSIPSSGFPKILNMEQQGKFIVGYYHQKQALYQKKSDKNDENHV